MQNRFIVIDVETPNLANDRISAIGITVVENGKIAYEFYSLVDPETGFDDFNIALTRITPEMVADKPTFPEIWNTIEPVMSSGLLVAHNAQFDMGVLAKCLCHYKISWHPYAYYACTCSMGRVCLPELPNHKLDTICRYLDVSLDHHNAGSDSRACAELLLFYIKCGLDVDRFIRCYDFTNVSFYRSTKKRFRTELSYHSKRLIELKSILSEIVADGVLSDEETLALQGWLDENASLKGNFPFDKIFEIVSKALADGILENEERESMLCLFEQITDPVSKACACGDIDINGKTFCLTGEFDFGERSEVQAVLVKRGGIPVSGVTRKTDYVIVGNKGSDAWCAGNYGTKVMKALELQSKGFPIKIVRETDLQF